MIDTRYPIERDAQRGGRAYAYFDELPVTTLFGCNGNSWRKQSTRTARFTDSYGNRVFYFSRHDLVEVGPYSRLASDYFKKV